MAIGDPKLNNQGKISNFKEDNSEYFNYKGNIKKSAPDAIKKQYQNLLDIFGGQNKTPGKGSGLMDAVNNTDVTMPESVKETGNIKTSPKQQSPLMPVVAEPTKNDLLSYTTNMMGNNKSDSGGDDEGDGDDDSKEGIPYKDALKQVAPNIALGGLQTLVGLGGLLTQGDVPEYEEPERLQQAYQDYGQIAEQGLPEVNAAARQRMARQINTGRQEAMDAAGPSTANAITAATTSQDLEGQRQIAEMEADQMLKGLQQQAQIAQTLRQIQDRRTQAQRQRYGRTEAAFGKAAQAGMGNMTNAFNLATGISGAEGYGYNDGSE